MTVIIFSIAIVFLVLQNIGYMFVSRHVRCKTDTILFTAIIVSMVSIISLALSGINFRFEAMTCLLGSLFGIFFALCEFSYMMALATGPIAYTSLFLSCALVIPTIAGVAFWGEESAALQVIGILLLIISFILGLGSQKTKSKLSVKWLIFGVLTFLSNGMVSVIQKAQQVVAGENHNSEFMTISFAAATALLWIIYAFLRKSGTMPSPVTTDSVKKILPFAAGAAIASAIGNRLVLYSAAKIDSVVMFPILNGSILMLCTLAAVLLFKEKLSKKQWIGMVMGVASVLLISL